MAAPLRITDQVLARAAQQPDAPALSDGLLSLSYGALAAETARIASELAARGVRPGDRVMVVGENSVTLGVLILACSRAGAVVVLENARRAKLEIAAIRKHCQPRLALFALAHSPDAEAHAAFAQAAPVHDAIGPYAASALDPEGASDDRCSPDLAAFIYTTGTTGTPKGVMLGHGALCFIVANMGVLRHMTPQDQVYGILPISHVMGQASVFLGALHAGAHLHLRPRFEAARCLQDLHDLRITALQGATAMFAKLAERASLSGWRAPPSLRFTAAGGAPIDPTVKRDAEAVFGTVLHNGYGLTEGASICWTRFEDVNDDQSVGRPLPGVELRIRDVDGADLPQGAEGELWARGPNMMQGYFRNPEQTARVMQPDGWFNTQDLARIADDGRVFILGRSKDVIIRSGFKVNPAEVETVLNSHPGISHSAVIGRAVPGNEEVLAFVELADGVAALPDDLDAHLRDALSPYKHPSHILVLPALPLAPNGKVLKHQLAQLAQEIPECPTRH